MSSDCGASPTKRLTESISDDMTISTDWRWLFGERADQPRLGEFAPVAVHRLGDAVGIEEQRVARGERRAALRIGQARHHAHRDPAGAGKLGARPVVAGQQRRVVPGIGVAQLAGLEIEDAVEGGDEQVERVLLAEEVVGVGEAGAGGAALAGAAPAGWCARSP